MRRMTHCCQNKIVMMVMSIIMIKINNKNNVCCSVFYYMITQQPKGQLQSKETQIYSIYESNISFNAITQNILHPGNIYSYI
jgi:hypothetical protein